MAQDYAEYLAVRVLNEQQFISYRNLSRVLKVHCNLAKQMLFDFHNKQNSRNPGSVHATYLLTGTKRPLQLNSFNSQRQDVDGDSVMESSPPFPGSSIPPDGDAEATETVPVKSIMLVREQDLVEAKAQFESISGIHIYSLQANSVNDVQVLTECNRRVAADYANEDPLQAWKQYGTIQNAHVRRRTNRIPPPANASAPTAKLQEPGSTMTTAEKPDNESRQISKVMPAEPSKNNATRPATSKKQNSDIFKSFAKGAVKPKAPESQESAAPTQPEDDVPMTSFSDDEESDGSGGLPPEVAEIKASSGKSRKEREDELKAMMEAEDQPMDDGIATAEGVTVVADPQVDCEDTKDSMVVENGRRRGKRRVMRKKTVKDEEGYLVTKEEAVWESFSEDEPASKKAKVATSALPKQPTAGGKKGGKPGQGNIMSFFGKK